MTLIVEDGSNVTGANSYVSVDDCLAYCAARGLSFGTSPTTTGEQALIRATKALDTIYGARFPGYRTNGRDQSLLWPRSEAYDAEDQTIDTDEIPQEIIDATCEFASREYDEANSILPDLDRGGDIHSIQAGSVSITYGGNATVATTFRTVDGILAPLLGAANATFMGEASRG